MKPPHRNVVFTDPDFGSSMIRASGRGVRRHLSLIVALISLGIYYHATGVARTASRVAADQYFGIKYQMATLVANAHQAMAESTVYAVGLPPGNSSFLAPAFALNIAAIFDKCREQALTLILF